MGDHDHAPPRAQTAEAAPVRTAPTPKANEPSHIAELRVVLTTDPAFDPEGG